MNHDLMNMRFIYKNPLGARTWFHLPHEIDMDSEEARLQRICARIHLDRTARSETNDFGVLDCSHVIGDDFLWRNEHWAFEKSCDRTTKLSTHPSIAKVVQEG